MTEIPPSHMVG